MGNSSTRSISHKRCQIHSRRRGSCPTNSSRNRRSTISATIGPRRAGTTPSMPSSVWMRRMPCMPGPSDPGSPSRQRNGGEMALEGARSTWIWLICIWVPFRKAIHIPPLILRGGNEALEIHDHREGIPHFSVEEDCYSYVGALPVDNSPNRSGYVSASLLPPPQDFPHE